MCESVCGRAFVWRCYKDKRPDSISFFLLNQEMNNCQMDVDPLKATHYGVKMMHTHTAAAFEASVSSDTLSSLSLSL